MAATTPETRSPEQRIARRVQLGLGAAAVGLALILPVSAIYGELNEPHIQPSVVRFDSHEACEAANFYVVFASGTGLQTVKYTARNSAGLAERYGACRLVLDYGTNADADYMAQQLVDSLVGIRGDNAETPAPVLLVGQSFGGIAMQQIANSPVILNGKQIDIAAILLESTPSDSSDIHNIPQVGFLVNKMPLPFGPVPVWFNGVLGAVAHGDSLLDRATWDYITDNTAQTSTKLIRQQLSAIEQGYPAPVKPIPVKLASSVLDTVVDSEKARHSLQAKIGAAYLKHYEVPAGYDQGDTNHANSWLSEKWPSYYKVYAQSFAEMYGQHSYAAKYRRQFQSVKKVA